MNKPWIGVVSELKVEGALEYLNVFPSERSLARRELSKAESALKQIWAIVHGEQKGTSDDKKAATERDQRVVAARDAVTEAQFQVDCHTDRRESALSYLTIYQTECANSRHVGNLR